MASVQSERKPEVRMSLLTMNRTVEYMERFKADIGYGEVELSGEVFDSRGRTVGSVGNLLANERIAEDPRFKNLAYESLCAVIQAAFLLGVEAAQSAQISGDING